MLHPRPHREQKLQKLHDMPNDPALLSRKAQGDLAEATEASGHLATATWTVYLSGCGRGIGIGLNARNVVTELTPDGPAALSGQLRLGDRVVGADGSALETPEGSRALAEVIRPADLHIFEVVRQDEGPTDPTNLVPHPTNLPPRSCDEYALSASTSSDGGSSSASTQATPAPRRASTPSDEDASRLFANLELRRLPPPSYTGSSFETHRIEQTGNLLDTPAAPPRLRPENHNAIIDAHLSSASNLSI